MLILAFRDRHANFAAIGYEKIELYTGLRREEISTAINLLVSMQLVRLLSDEDGRDAPATLTTTVTSCVV